MHYSGALYIIHYISCVINLRVITEAGVCEGHVSLPDDCDRAEAGGYLPRNQRAAPPPGGAHRLARVWVQHSQMESVSIY